MTRQNTGILCYLTTRIMLSDNSYSLFPQTISHDGKLCSACSCSSLPWAIVQEHLSD